MKLTKDEVQKVALLARLRLSDAEVESMTRQLGEVLGYVEQLEGLDTEGVEPMAHAIELENVLAEDLPQPSLPRDKALSVAPKTDGETFLVPPVL